MRHHSRVMQIFVCAMFLLAAANGLAGPNSEDATTAADVKEQAAETYETIKRYTLEQRDEAMAAASEQVARLDRRIDSLEKELDQRWEQMSQSAREETREALATMRQKRTEVAEWYGGMRHSSADAWEDVKQGFADSYDRLRKAFDDAQKEFDEGA